MTSIEEVFNRLKEAPPEIDQYGTKRWFKNGLRHRDNGPAVIWATGEEFWYENGFEVDSEI